MAAYCVNWVVTEPRHQPPIPGKCNSVTEILPLLWREERVYSLPFSLPLSRAPLSLASLADKIARRYLRRRCTICWRINGRCVLLTRYTSRDSTSTYVAAVAAGAAVTCRARCSLSLSLRTVEPRFPFPSFASSLSFYRPSFRAMPIRIERG